MLEINGHFGMIREELDDCEICQTFPHDKVRSRVVDVMLNSWDKQWMEMYEWDHNEVHDNFVVALVNGRNV